MTLAYETTGGRWIDVDATSDQGHPMCSFCGGVMVDEGDRVVCENCRTDALADPKPAVH